MAKAIPVEYKGKRKYQGSVFHILKDQIASVNGHDVDYDDRDITQDLLLSPGDSVVVKSNSSRSGRSCSWEGTVMEYSSADDNSESQNQVNPSTSDPSASSISKGKAKQKTSNHSKDTVINVLKCVDLDESSPTNVAKPRPESTTVAVQPEHFDNDYKPNDHISEIEVHLTKFADKMTKSIEGMIANKLGAVHNELRILDEKVELLSQQVPTSNPASLIPIQDASHTTPLGSTIPYNNAEVESILSDFFDPSVYGGESTYDAISIDSDSNHLPLAPVPSFDLGAGMPTPQQPGNMITPCRPMSDSVSIFSPGASSTSSSTKSLIESPAIANVSLKEKKRVEHWVINGYSAHLTLEQIIVKNNFKTPTANWVEWHKLGLQVVKHNIFGERTLSLSSLSGRDLKILDPAKVGYLKDLLKRYAPAHQNGAEFEMSWSDLRGKINQMCKRLRQLVEKYSLKEKAEQLDMLS